MRYWTSRLWLRLGGRDKLSARPAARSISDQELAISHISDPSQYLRAMSHTVIKPYVPKHKSCIGTVALLFDGHDAAINIIQ